MTLRLSSIVLRILAMLVGMAVVFSTQRAPADELDKIRERGVLRWGGDQNGGGPYVFPDEKNPEIPRGFEVELADALAKSLGVRAEFVQGDWEKVPELINAGRIDIALNGYELTADRESLFLCSVPYYVYGFQLLVRTDSPIHSWADLENGKGRAPKIGALIDSAALSYLQPKSTDSPLKRTDLKLNPRLKIEAVTYDGATDSMQKVVDGVDDGTLQDDPTAIFYANQFPALRRVGRPVSTGYYVALMGKEETRLKAAIDKAIDQMIHDGSLKAIYDRWDLSGKVQMLALGDLHETMAPAAHLSFADIVRNNWLILLQAAGMTVLLSVVSMPLAVLIGILVACGRMYGPWLIAKPLGLYVELLRGTPLMLQLYAIFFLLPKIGLVLPALVAAIAGLAINYSAYEAEIYRAGLQAVPRGQMEAALSLGMSRRLAVWRIILPQAFRIVIPPVTNDFISLFKDTSVCSVCTVVELTKEYDILAMSTGAIVQLAIITATLYMLMSYPLSVFARWNERRLGISNVA